MTSTDAIRWGWTFLNGFGVLFALYNLRDVLIDHWAISQLTKFSNRPVHVLTLQTRGEVWNHTLILIALGTDFLAGICSLFELSIAALICLILSAVALLVLSFTEAERRRRLLRALPLRPKEEAKP